MKRTILARCMLALFLHYFWHSFVIYCSRAMYKALCWFIVVAFLFCRKRRMQGIHNYCRRPNYTVFFKEKVSYKRRIWEVEESYVIIFFLLIPLTLWILGGIPNMKWCGTDGDHNVLVMDLLGRSLEDLFVFCGSKFSLKTVLMLADQMVTTDSCLDCFLWFSWGSISLFLLAMVLGNNYHVCCISI